MSKNFKISSKTQRSTTMVDSDGYEVRFDASGVATTQDEHTAAYFAGLPERFGFTVEPTPAPAAALPPRGPATRAAAPPPPPPVKTNARQGDLGVEFDPEPEGQFPSEGPTVSPKDSPIVPELMASVLRERYPETSDRVDLVKGLVTPGEFLTGIVASMDPGEQLRVMADVFPEATARLSDLERANNEHTAALEAARAKLTSAAERIAALEAELAATAKDPDTAGKSRRK